MDDENIHKPLQHTTKNTAKGILGTIKFLSETLILLTTDYLSMPEIR